MAATDALERGREAFGRRVWREAYAQLLAADREVPLAVEDLRRLATVAHLIGRDDESADAWARAHHACLRLDNPASAIRCAFWLAFGLLNRGELARGGGWLARARRLLDNSQSDCVEQGYLLMAAARQHLAGSDAALSLAIACQVATIANRFADADLMSLAGLCRGRALLALGRAAEGVTLLDEVMISVTTGEVSPIAVGSIYCAVIEACLEIGDLRRAQEWTAALEWWCASQPDLVPYRGRCLVYRAELMQLRGAWTDAEAELRQACEWLSQPPDQPVAGLAFYRRAEIHRLRGEFVKAEAAYREASLRGHEPQPGLALLRLIQGQLYTAAAAIRRVTDSAPDRTVRSEVLAAHVEIMLMSGDSETARAAADELSTIAAEVETPLLRAVAAQARGAVFLAEGNAPAACAALRDAWTAWQELQAPYEAARVRVLIGLTYRQLGDGDTAALELAAARRVFRQLGAAPDLARVEALARAATLKRTGGLSARELQVLRQVAAGKSNRAIAAAFCLSERTVDRHVSNVFAKLGVSSRAAATAYAYLHDLL
jgi:DNA-binding CsgD family transcriptional regulator